ncbi:MAG: DUF2783 domain-containing protein [Rhodospirillales bacterium]
MNDPRTLKNSLNIAAPDEFYAELIELHRNLSDGQCRLVDAKLILLLANQVGDMAVLRQAMKAARAGVA